MNLIFEDDEAQQNGRALLQMRAMMKNSKKGEDDEERIVNANARDENGA